MAMFDLALSGGGVKGVCLIGALEVLLRKHQVRRIIGTSVGGLAALGLAAGFGIRQLLFLAQDRDKFGGLLQKPSEKDFPAGQGGPLRALFGSIDLGGQRDRPLLNLLRGGGQGLMLQGPFAERMYQFAYLIQQGAVFTDEKFLPFVRHLIELQGYPPDIGFADLYAKTKKHFSLTTADTTAKELLILNHVTAPTLPVSWAVRMSASIPFVWPEVVWRAEWGTYLGTDRAGHTLVDGGLGGNMPLRYLIDPSPENQKLMGPPADGQARPLGLYLDESQSMPGIDPKAEQAKLLEKLKPFQILAKLIETAGTATDRLALKQFQAEGAVCKIPTKGFSYLDFDLTLEQVEILLNSGRCAMTEYLQKIV